MFPEISARSNDWNRKYNFNSENGNGFLMDSKNGLSFFAWKGADDSVKFYKCEQTVFEKNFEILEGKIEHEFDPYENISFLRYPTEM